MLQLEQSNDQTYLFLEVCFKAHWAHDVESS